MAKLSDTSDISQSEAQMLAKRLCEAKEDLGDALDRIEELKKENSWMRDTLEAIAQAEDGSFEGCQTLAQSALDGAEDGHG